MTIFDHQSRVQQAYDARSEAYLTSGVHAAGADLEWIAQRVGNQPDAIGLDLGCGGGHVSFRLAPQVFRVVAYDVAEKMLETVTAEARRRAILNIVCKQGAAETLPCASDAFDFVVTRYSAHHWRDMAAGLRQMQRVLKPGGVAVFSDVVAPGTALQDTWLQALELLRDTSHVRNARLSTWICLLEEAGFVVEKVIVSRLRLDFPSWIARTQTPPAHVAAMRSLQIAASAEVQTYFALEADGSFTVDQAVISAVKP